MDGFQNNYGFDPNKINPKYIIKGKKMSTVQYHLYKIINMQTGCLKIGMGRERSRGQITKRQKATFGSDG